MSSVRCIWDMVEVTEPDEVIAVWEGEIPGDTYDGGDTTYADREALEKWRDRRFGATALRA